MKKICLSLLSLLFVTLPALAEYSGLPEVESESVDWEVSMQNDTAVRAFNEKYQVELKFNISDLLPSSPQCLSNKRIKDVKFTVNIYKTAQDGDFDWAKSFEQMRIRFSGRGKTEERKPYGSNLVKNNIKVNEGQTLNIGTLQFLSPYVCNDIWNAKFYVSDMKAGGRGNLPALEFQIIHAEDKDK